MPWQLIIPSDDTAARETDAYGRPIRATKPDPIEFRGYSEPLGESKTEQHDVGHVTRGDQTLWVTKNGIADLNIFQPGMEIIDITGTRWGIVAVDNFQDKIHPGQGTDSKFMRLQITRKALQ